MSVQKEAPSRFPLRFSLVFTIVFVVLYWPGVILLPYRGAFRHLEDVWHDRLFQFHEGSLKPGDRRIVITALDEDTGKIHGYPLPRKVLAQILDKLKEYGVKTVAFDMVFFEPREGDAELIAATRRFKRVVHLFVTYTKETAAGDVVSMDRPIPGLGEAAENLGYPNIDPVLDPDGHVRRAILFDRRVRDPKRPGLAGPTLEIAAFSSYTGAPVEELAERFDAEGFPPLTRVVNFRAPQAWLTHERRDLKIQREGKTLNLQEISSPYRTISAMDLLSGQLTDAQRKALKGALVLIGSTTLGYFDHYPTPFTPQAPGVEYHANVLDNMLNDDFMRVFPRGVILLAILLMIWLPYFLHQRAPPLVAAAASGGVFAVWTVFAVWKFGQGVRVEFVAPGTALILCFLVQTVHRVLTEGQEKRRIKGLFGQFVAPEVVADLAANPDKVKLGGEKREMTMLFLDIAHFTTISEKMAPEQLILFLNRYLSALSGVVQRHQAVVGNYIGDCIMAFWNAPILPVEDHRAQACLAAVECQEIMKELNAKLDVDMPETPAIRVGLNSGNVTVGLTGSEKKLQYTTLGDEVNLASRLEGANKFFGSKVMASEATYSGPAREAVAGRELGRVRVVGKETPIRVFELLAPKDKLPDEWRRALPHYERGHKLFYDGEYASAVAAFQEVLKIVPEDGPSTVYLNAAKDYSAIPPDDKAIVFNLTAK